MPWCPKCKSEYREGFTVCADCGVELVENLPEEKEAPAGFVCRNVEIGVDPFAGGQFTEEEQPVFLVGIEDAAETARLCELLDSCHIPNFPIHRVEPAEGEAADSEEDAGEFPDYVEIAVDSLPEDMDDLDGEEEDDSWYDEMMAEEAPSYEIHVPTYLFDRALTLLEEDEANMAAAQPETEAEDGDMAAEEAGSAPEESEEEADW